MDGNAANPNDNNTSSFRRSEEMKAYRRKRRPDPLPIHSEGASSALPSGDDGVADGRTPWQQTVPTSISDEEQLKHLSDRPDEGIQGWEHRLAGNHGRIGFGETFIPAILTRASANDLTSTGLSNGSSYYSASSDIYSSGQSRITPSSVRALRIEQSGNVEDRSPKLSVLRPNVESLFPRAIRTLSLEPPLMEEQNWSGRGQHVEFQPGETVPLTRTRDEPIGTSATAYVEAVRCRRVLLARKSMRLSHRMELETVLREVQHLQRLNHAHIVRLVGTYLQGPRLSILMYPVADWNLTQFLDICHPNRETTINVFGVADETVQGEFYEMTGLFTCLSSAVAYIHAKKVIHLDIKPANVLVRKLPLRSDARDAPRCRAYLCDFGLSRDFSSHVQSQTSTFPGMTATYASPEVTANLPHGRAADIFSLGCVFLEIATTISAHSDIGLSIDRFASARRASSESNDASFQGNPNAVEDWIEVLKSIVTPQPFDLDQIKHMLAHDPARRPVAEDWLGHVRGSRACCGTGREEFEADE